MYGVCILLCSTVAASYIIAYATLSPLFFIERLAIADCNAHSFRFLSQFIFILILNIRLEFGNVADRSPANRAVRQSNRLEGIAVLLLSLTHNRIIV